MELVITAEDRSRGRTRMIDEALRRTNGNKQAAARLLGLKRTTLVAKLRRKRAPDYQTPQSYAF